MDIIRGACMAVADSVPGVSGGTIAFLLGFYDKFISSVDDLLTGTMAEKKAAFPFLFKLAVGWAAAFLICAVILANLFDTYVYEISSVFIGLTVCTVPIVVMEEKETLKGHYLHSIFAVIGVAAVPLLMYFNPVTRESSVDLTQVSLELGLFLFIAAVLSISVMVLPGISGSTMLLIMGLYVPLISAVSAVVHLQFQYVPMLIVFGLGMITGLVFIAKLLRHCLEKYRSQTIYLSIGLLIGSLYAIVMGATTLDVPKPAMSFETFSILFFLLGAAILAGLQYMKKRAEKKSA
jgi:putative membrane protein